ncbi:hypothetical protein A1O7_09631 [Cladophialophora yegresii CBS 114405]|uniref:BTB domain-containing protein n=1 Tax=Cladophialophora yegresii CBS 114405 TaxID=1182544 RepID=W9VFM4_9EURO|nr:uncharacterized protein A1O7_09631 [Cladophialophora yegresii CBS 114405]EXJ54293.1 hypothetical protein A1O7_09631 [Cladophialophora yegresii CBS 114405]
MDNAGGHDAALEGVSGSLLADELLEGTTEEIDPRGDLILVVGPRRLLVSSKVLELSCPFFKTMLRSNAFHEGVEQPNIDKPPVKSLRDDHPDMFALICRVLHYLPVCPPASMEDYRALADLCDFYGCRWALSFHVRAWMEALTLSSLSTYQLQTSLWAAYVFHLVDLFGRVSVQLAEAMTPQEWRDWEVHPMPARLKDDMRHLCESVKYAVQLRIEDALDAVGENNERHTGKRDKICSQCYRNKPSATKKCGNCGSSEFQDYFCTKELRLSLFKEWLQSRGYWPLSRLNNQSCRSYLRNMHGCIDSRTPCGFDNSCPLTEAKEHLTTTLRSTLGDFAGLLLGVYDDEYLRQSPLVAVPKVLRSPTS